MGGAAAVVQGVIGNRSDRVFCEFSQEVVRRIAGRRGLPANHDALRAMRSAQLQALDLLVSKYQKHPDPDWAGFSPPYAKHFVDRAQAWISEELHKAGRHNVDEELAKRLDAAAEEAFLNPADAFDPTRLAQIRTDAEEAVRAELTAALSGVAVPAQFEALFCGKVEGVPAWADAFAAFLMEALKTDTRFCAVFTTTKIVEIVELTRGIPEIARRVEALPQELDTVVAPLVRALELLRLDMLERQGRSAPNAAGARMRYAAGLAANHLSQSWARDPIDLQAVTEDGNEVSARTALQDWLDRPAPRSIVILGDFGSGKTGLMCWFAAEIASERQELPLLISFRDLRNAPPHSFSALSELAVNAPDQDLAAEAAGRREVVLLLDALDEIMRPTDTDLSEHASALEALAQSIPGGARIALTCRTMFYTGLAEEALPFLEKQRSHGCVDRTEDAIAMALNGIVPDRPAFLKLTEVKENDARRYLSGLNEAMAREVERRPDLAQFARAPFTLRLLETALPLMLDEGGVVDLDRLYETAISATLLRDHRIARKDVDYALNTLSLCALSRVAPPDDIAEAALACGMLVEADNGAFSFRHNSYFEFFLSRAIAIEMADYRSIALARFNLIGAYNVCRFLVPRLKRGYDVGAVHAGAPSYVSGASFADFCKKTGWRMQTGFGHHPPSALGYTSVQGIALDRDGFALDAGGAEPAANISWFDAFQYCKWSNRVMLASNANACEAGAPVLDYSWAHEWHDESRAYLGLLPIRVGESGGANPDFRSAKVGLVVV
ncbi:hypothetical protein ATE48_06870 [Candidatus Viadribacter manganicus]|uniref:NACHT domain-containing protein n=2 Tax=Candidatus Viadribacter manganicus TaxID=1759059 RepID=A0A1B1AGG7_9PROT|nr:hypothetical protein ATE48_06870 [Candidatus Viadribacter manganicus]